ncbi:MAG: hypothetical protein ACTSWH_02225 [Promethearchaeota archaeon]
MISKEEAEGKLLKIFNDVKLDRYFKKNPTVAKIEVFEETKEPDEFDHFYGIKNDELKLGIWANNLENGIAYIAVQMAFDSAKMWREDFYCRHVNLFSCLYLIIPLMTILFGRIIKDYSLIAAILINIVGNGILIYFFVLTYKWKKRLLVRFKGFFENTGISLPEETFKNYSKSPLSALYITYFFQCFIVLLIALSWVFAFSKEI